MVISSAENNANQVIADALDNGKYNDAQLLTIKIPIAYLPPYFYETNEYERANGQMAIEGVQYNFVKYRYNRDTLELLCILNNQATAITAEKFNLLRNMNDIKAPAQNKRSNSTNGFTNFIVLYNIADHFFTYRHFNCISSKKTFYLIPFTPFYCSSVIENPPEIYFAVEYNIEDRKLNAKLKIAAFQKLSFTA